MQKILFLILYGSFSVAAQPQQLAALSQNNSANNQILNTGGSVAATAAMSAERIRAWLAEYDKQRQAPLRVATRFATAAQMTDQDESEKDGYASSEDSDEDDATYLNKKFDLDLPTPKGYTSKTVHGKKVFERHEENTIITDPDFIRLIIDDNE